MAGDIKLKYGTDAAFTQTNLDGIASSSTLVAGWTSETITNSSENIDYYVTGQFQVESSGLSAGTIAVYAYAALNDTPTWPDLFSAGTEGTEGTATIHDSEVRDGAMHLVAAITTDTTASRYYSFPPTSIAQLFGGTLPKVWALFVTQSTGAALETTSDPNQVYYMPVMAQYT